MIQPGENILLDDGSTAGALAHDLGGFDRLSVTAPGINTLPDLVDSAGIEVNCLRDRLRGVAQSFVGPLAEAALEQVQKFRDAVQVEGAAVSG